MVSIVKRKEIDTACTFLEEDLPAVAGKIRASLEKVNNHIYTKVFQAFGDNVRSSGNPLSQAVVAEALLSLPEMIARIIKIFRLRSGQSSAARNYFVIDASRHPFEIRFLRERIAPFYVMAVTTNDDDRKARLGTKLLPKEIEDLDKKEYPSESGQNRDTYRAFVSQDIQACLELADVYISNPGTSKPIDTRKTAQQVCRYVALMQRPGIVTPTHIERCMQAAFLAKLNSGCISRQVGASITDRHNSIKAIGWNDVAQGQVPCLLRNVSDLLKGRDEDAYSKYEKDDKFTDKIKELYPGDLSCSRIGGRNNMYCFKSVHNKITEKENQVHTRSLRAEENAFLQLAKYGSPGIEGGRLFTTASPCELCAKKAYQLGIKEIYYVDPYLGISNDHIFASGAEPPRVILFSDAVGRAYYELYEPLMPLNRLRKKGGRAQYSFIKHGQIEI